MKTSRSSTLSLRVPIANEEERALFQRRLALTCAVVFTLGFGFFVVLVISFLAIQPKRLLFLSEDVATWIHVGTSLAALALWLTLRRGRWSVQVLDILDYVVGVALCLGWAAMAGSGKIPISQRPELIALMASTFTLSVRAALLPSTPGRTLLVGVAGIAPIVVFTSHVYAGVLPVATGEDQWLPRPLDAGVWGALTIAATTVSSHTIYGLRQQIRKAMQLGQYSLEEKIGEGGMGVVYRASHALLRRPTAVKLLSGAAGHQQANERFEREVQITAGLTHPNTIAIFDYGRTPDGVFYYAMEYLDGITLEQLVLEDGPQPVRRVAHVILQMCGALAEAHAAGLVHRDIKPANVMLTERGGVRDVIKVLDFGLVKESAAAEASADTLATSAVNTILGTPHYMAPETILDPANIDGRADLYAVGATAYYLLTGTHVFDGSNLVEICSQHLHEAPMAPSIRRPDIPEALDRVVLACLAKAPADRPENAGALAAMIRACAVGDWVPGEATAWWEARKDAPSVSAVKSGRALGETLAVELEGRERE